MPGYVVPDAPLEVGRPITVNGVRYAVGDVLPLASAVEIKALDALLSNGTLVPANDPHHRRRGSKPLHTATSTGAAVRRSIAALLAGGGGLG